MCLFLSWTLSQVPEENSRKISEQISETFLHFFKKHGISNTATEKSKNAQNIVDNALNIGPTLSNLRQ